MKIKRMILSGGGTGGHIYPALALYRRLKEVNPQLEVLYVGTEKGLESTIVPKEGIPFSSVEIQGIKRSLSLENVKAIWLMMTSTQRAKKIIREFEPDIVIGTGGYVCAPVLLAAAQEKIPTLIHEQNSVAGITNKFLARFVDKIAISFPEVEKDFSRYSQKVVLTGNPRGQEVVQTSSEREILAQQFGLNEELPTILVFGGSRGAPAINQASLAAIKYWQHKDYQVIIATGASHFEELAKESQFKDLEDSNIRVVPYIDNMPAVFQAIDLVVCRSGATTLTELTALGLPSVLIPSPYVTNNHQEHNAMALVHQQAAKMIKETDLTAENIFEITDKLITTPLELRGMAKNAQLLGITDASERIIQTMEEML